MTSYRIRPIRFTLIASLLIPAAHLDTFYDHFYAYLTGNVLNDIIRQHWDIVIVSIVIFLACLIPLSFRRKANWAEYGLVTAFFVSLFVEMYGIPFTILLAQKWFYQSDIFHPKGIIDFHLLGTHFEMDLPMVYAAALIIAGALIIVVAWITLYYGVKRNTLVTTGVYATSRHPQYLGFILIITGWLIGWPTLLTIMLVPILIYRYVRAAQQEEMEVPDRVAYQRYKERVPFMI